MGIREVGFAGKKANTVDMSLLNIQLCVGEKLYGRTLVDKHHFVGVDIQAEYHCGIHNIGFRGVVGADEDGPLPYPAAFWDAANDEQPGVDIKAVAAAKDDRGCHAFEVVEIARRAKPRLVVYDAMVGVVDEPRYNPFVEGKSGDEVVGDLIVITDIVNHIRRVGCNRQNDRRDVDVLLSSDEKEHQR